MAAKKVFIIPNLTRKGTDALLRAMIGRLRDCGCVPMLEERIADSFDGVQCGAFEQLIAACDMVVTVGGDGTILHSAKHAIAYDKPLLGVNTGRLGYLAQIEANELDMLTRLATGDYRIHERMLLECTVEGTLQTHYALNDVVVFKGELARMVDLDVTGDGQPLGSYRSDGLIIATPTGSTAYSLSAGGPIVHPQIDTIVLTPICPHSLDNRAVLLPGHMAIEVRSRYVNHSDSIIVSVDGENIAGFDSRQTVHIRRSEKSVRFIGFVEKNFNSILSKKLKARG